MQIAYPKILIYCVAYKNNITGDIIELMKLMKTT